MHMEVTWEQKIPIQKARAVFLHEGKILIVPSTRRPGYFVLPGGHVEEGEDYVQALIRELREELSVEVNAANIEHLSSYTLKAPRGRGKIITQLYLVHKWQGTLIPSGDITGMQWITPHDLKAQRIRHGSGILSHVVPALKQRGLL